MVRAKSKNKDEFGIDAYENPHVRFNPFNAKSYNFSVSKDTMARDHIS